MWRPGRYELGNFAKNVRGLAVFDAEGNALPFRKVASHQWEVLPGNATSVVVSYAYYAHKLDAGNTFVDAQQVYVNPVNCCVYVPGREAETCSVELNFDAKQVATGLQREGDQWLAANFQELADSPFIASDAIKHHSYECCGATFHLWFQGEARPDMARIETDFKAFTEAQHGIMGSFPFDAYHFLFQVPPYKTYHGVEHLNSTVIALGPGYDLMEPHLYKEFIGVSSHELFHAWNVKAIRPAEMQPYDFGVENYSRLGYVAEGVTTYYGDLFLLRSGYFDAPALLELLAQHAQRHFHNFGRLNYSVADSSFDTWLDGYVRGVPDRKLSIYSDGALLALIADVAIRMATDNRRSLDDAMRLLYDRVGKTSAGYTEDDYFSALESVAATSFADFRTTFFEQANDYGNALRQALDWLGLELQDNDPANSFEADFGFKIDAESTVQAVHPLSPAADAGFAVGDVILGINDYRLKNDLKGWCKYFRGETIALDISKAGRVQRIELTPAETPCYSKYAIVPLSTPTAAQAAAWKAWSS